MRELFQGHYPQMTHIYIYIYTQSLAANSEVLPFLLLAYLGFLLFHFLYMLYLILNLLLLLLLLAVFFRTRFGTFTDVLTLLSSVYNTTVAPSMTVVPFGGTCSVTNAELLFPLSFVITL